MDLAFPADGEGCLVGALRDYFGTDDLSGAIAAAARVAISAGEC
jgi:hypothetical protein